MKNSPLMVGIILLVVGLIGLVFKQFSVLWMWAIIIVGIVVIIWTGMSKKDKDTIIKK